MPPHERFPWGRLMQLGIGTLGLSPQDFWRCTLREIMVAMPPVAPPLQRGELDGMMDEWPDD